MNLTNLVGSADVGAAAADAVDGGDDVGALEAGLAHVDDGVQLTERVVVASQVEALGVVGLDGRVVAVEVLQLELDSLEVNQLNVFQGDDHRGLETK